MQVELSREEIESLIYASASELNFLAGGSKLDPEGRKIYEDADVIVKLKKALAKVEH